MRFLILFSMIAFFGVSEIDAQEDKIDFDNAQIINEERYQGFKGNAYYFQLWVYGDVYNQSGGRYEDLLLNYNIETSTFEVKDGKRYIELDPRNYWAVVVNQDQNVINLDEKKDSVVFIRGLIPDDERKFVEVVYNGSRVKLLKDLFIVTTSQQVENLGQNTKLKRFTRKDRYFLVVDGEYKKIKMNKKDALKTMGHKKELEKWLNSNNNKLTMEKDWMALMQYFEENHLSPLR